MTEPSPITSDSVSDALGLGVSARKGRRWMWLLLLLVPLLAALAWMLRPQDGISYRSQPATQGDLTVTVTATGELAPVNQVEVGTEVSGTVAEVLTDYNQQVKTGQVLARIDTDQLQAAFDQAKAAAAVARAEVAQAQATLDEADAKYRRSQQMKAQGFCSQEECDAAKASRDRAVAGLAMAKAQVDQAVASLESRRTALEKAQIRSPISGIVLERKVEPGQTVAASLQTPVLFVLAESLAQMELLVAVDEADVGQVAEGQQATFTVDAFPGRTFPAVITQLRYAPKTVEGVVSYEAVLRVDNSDLLLRPGMTATAEIEVAHVKDALLVPNSALRFTPHSDDLEAMTAMVGGNGKAAPAPRVWLLKDGEPKPLEVQTGQTDGRMTAITGGDLSVGTEVLVDQVMSKGNG